MRKKISSILLATTFLAAVAIAQPAEAQHWRGDIHGFRDHDYDHWRGGRWYNGWHDGRMGWWWMVDNGWYYYPTPVYPYPDPYTPPVVVTEAVPATPPTVQPAYLYYCGNPAGYYPYIPHCYVEWQKVAPTSAGAPPPATAPRPAPVESQRELDAQHLAGYQVELQNIDMQSSHARSRLKSLEHKVAEFRESLYQRPYNAAELLHQAQMLQQTIADQRNALAHPGSMAPEPAPMMAPPQQ